ncbi:MULTISPECIES: cation:proton antiporter [Thermomonosporaceae]|uniref:cation:proton antiporter n=1 Tax=Thermomonosporaceae TaxID=2012 RepID=UPI00255AF562|nr:MULTISPECIES: cation:proton antiporter [Thermomonosporaceae]MDL4775328.1 cation:proton antiporter [Actinomadura xylanilytica]
MMIQTALAAGSAQSPESIAGIVLGDLALILLAAAVFAALAKRVRQPAVMGEIVAGIALGPSVLGLLPGDLTGLLFPPSARPYLQVLAQVGLVLFMFGVGYGFSPSHLSGAGGRVMLVSLSSVALPFALGAGLAVLLNPWFDRSEMRVDDLLAPTLFLGAAMSITAFPVLARIITERGMQRDRLGSMALASAAFQDFLAWCVLAGVVAIVSAGGSWSLARTLLGGAAFILVLLWGVRPGLAWLLSPARPWAGGDPVAATVLGCGLLASAWATHEIGLHAVFGAFLFGAVVPREHVEAHTPAVPERIEQTSLLLLPVFFTVTGLSVDFGRLGGRGAVMVAAVIAVACAGKFAGGAGMARLTGETAGASLTLGVLLNTRGLTELVILNVGLGLGVLDSRLFTAMVIMALVTTLMTGPLLDLIHSRAEPEPLDRREARAAGRSGG